MGRRIRQKRDNNPPQNGEIIRYGKVIGYAVCDATKGSWIDKSAVVLPKAPPPNPPSQAAKVSEPPPPPEDYTLEGYRNADSSVDTRNPLDITTGTHCMADAVNHMIKIIERNLLSKYPSIDGVVDLNHLYGCGVAINAPTAVVPTRIIHNIALNPNFDGEMMVVGFDCEKLQPQRLQKGTENVQSIPVDRASIIRLQDEQHVGFKSMVDDTLQTAVHHLEKLDQASASPARPPSWWRACTAVAATRSPALPLTPLSATPLTCWYATAQR